MFKALEHKEKIIIKCKNLHGFLQCIQKIFYKMQNAIKYFEKVMLIKGGAGAGGGALHFLNVGVLCFTMDPLKKLKL
jgi:hypothetical protein